MITDRSFHNMFQRTRGAFVSYAHEVHTARWQGMDISKRPDMVSYELLNWNCNVGMDFLTQLYSKDGDWSSRSLLLELAHVIEPNLPWADDHFEERVGGEPLNPGVQWASWPWAASADKHRTNLQFNHTYMERLWPKYATLTGGGKLGIPGGGSGRGLPGEDDELISPQTGCEVDSANYGLRHELGDLWSLVELLAHEPDTRQAWIPLFFPEDTGVGDGGRKPCTLGYQIIVRNKAASIYYPLRSCDFVRHFRDDIYLAIRLLLWMIDRCREINPEFWGDVVPGYYAMHCTSLHVFENDYRQMRGDSSK